MIFADLPNGASVFLDANVLVYHFQPHPTLGTACTELIERIENQELTGFTSSHVLAELAHRLMTLEACRTFGWPFAGIAQRLKRHPAEVQQLVDFRRALQEIPLYQIQILATSGALVDAAAAISQLTGLLTNDALVAASMQANGLVNLASHDADFDRVPGIVRYAPA